MKRTISVAVSGSFHQHMMAIQEAVEAFRDRGVKVLSPADPRVVDSVGSFLFVASDRHRSVRLVQDRHLAAIGQSDFLWVVSPDGYVGQSASLELGFAIALGIPIYGEVLPPDLTLREYVKQVNSIDEAIRMVESFALANERVPSLLIDPPSAIDIAHGKLENIRDLITSSNNCSGHEITREVYSDIDTLHEMFTLITLKTK